MSPDVIGAFVGFLLTLLILTYILADNPAYRVAIHIFVGAAAGYAVVVAVFNVLYPQMIAAFEPWWNYLVALVQDPSAATQPDATTLIIPGGALVLGVLFLIKALGSRLGGFATAFMVGVGVAVAIGGAITGTLLPQADATALSLLPRDPQGALDLGRIPDVLIILVGTLATLGYFYYGARRRPTGAVERPLPVRPVAFVGQIFIGAAFGVMYAGALAASLAYFAQGLNDLMRLPIPGVGG
jgi:amino acid transporter